MHRPMWFRSPVVLILITCLRPTLAQFHNDFSAYPAGTQSCFYAAANSSSCDGSTVDAMNECLCGNGGDFVTNSAQCVGQQDPADSTSAFAVLQSSCSTSGTPLGISLSDWQTEVSKGIASTTSASATSTSSTSTSTRLSSSTGTATTTTSTTTTTTTTPTASSTTAASPNELSSSAKIGIGVGSAVAVIAVLGALLLFILRRRRRRHTAEEVNPMMADAHNQNPPGSFTGHQLAELPYETRAGLGSAVPSTAESKQTNSWVSSPSVAGAPWSPNSYDAIIADGQQHHFYRPPPQDDIYELASDDPQPSFAGPPAELPTGLDPPSNNSSPSSGYSELGVAHTMSHRPEHHELSTNEEGRSLV